MKKIIYILSCLCICLLISANVQAQTCSTNFTVSTQITNSTCLSNGEIRVTLGGDTTNIFNVQYGLTSAGGFTINPQSDRVLRNIPPGTYQLTVRAFCKVSSEYDVVKTVSNLVVGGTYKVPEASFNPSSSRKSYEGCNTGIIALNVINGSGNFTFTITSAPAGVATGTVIPTKVGTIYTFPAQNYPSGDYTVQVEDGCYTAVHSFTLGQVSGFPTFTYSTSSGFRPVLTDFVCDKVYWSAGSVSSNTNLDYYRYYQDGMYEVGVAPTGAMPTTWVAWTSSSANLLMDISPYSISDFYGANSISIYTRVKGCDTNYISITTNIKKPTYGTASTTIVYCDYYQYSPRPWTDYDGMLCYPLSIKAVRVSDGATIFENPAWSYTSTGIPLNLDYSVAYNLTFTDQKGTVYSTNIDRTNISNVYTPISFNSEILNCDNYQLSYYASSLVPCYPILVTIRDALGNVVCTDSITNSINRTSCPLDYGQNYTFSATYVNSVPLYTYTAVKNVASSAPTTYTLTTSSSYDSKCFVNRSALYVTANKVWPIGTTFTITGPSGYVSQQVTTTSSNSYYNMPITDLPPGAYTLTANHPCGSPVVSTVNLTGIYNYNNFSYSTQTTCSGQRITPTGTMTYRGNPVSTYYRLTSGPTGYDKSVITQGGSFVLSTPGTYQLGILADNSTTGCVIKDTTIVYTAPSLALDPSATSAYVCVDGNIGNISVKAINGVAPYTYELWNKNNTAKVGVSDITTSGVGTFTYGQADSTYTVRMKDQCGNMFSQQITLSNLETARVVYVSSDPTCTGSTIQLRCITLGNTSYDWTGPNGFTSSDQNPVITNAKTNMTGWYKVSVMPEFCGSMKVDSVYITVTPPLAPVSGQDSLNVSVCVREKMALNSEMTGGTGVYTYQWQSSSNGVSWTNISGATSAAYTPPVRVSSGVYYYRRITTDTACGVFYNVVTFNITPCYIRINPNIGGNVKK